MREQLTHLTKRTRLSVVVIALFMMLLNQSVNLAQTNQAPQLALVPVTEEGVASRVTDLALTADGRFFLVQKDGLVLIAQASGVALEEPFLDISSRVRDSWEQGMLALTFHPDYENNGYFYVSYSSDEFAGATIISRFQVSEDDPNLADAKSEVILLNIPDPHPIHQGGDLAFGPSRKSIPPPLEKPPMANSTLSISRVAPFTTLKLKKRLRCQPYTCHF